MSMDTLNIQTNRAFRRRFRQTQVGLGVLAASLMVFWLLGDWSIAIWIGVLVAWVSIALGLEIRGQRCPHCGGLVLGDMPHAVGITLLSAPPGACRKCGHSLEEF
jgi:hypothetical protein